jgi:hypothetical protein
VTVADIRFPPLNAHNQSTYNRPWLPSFLFNGL